jgi:hypothetical protein
MVVQVSVDIAVTDEEYNGTDIAETVAKTLEEFDYKVLGSAWKATWTDEGYAASESPIASD